MFTFFIVFIFFVLIVPLAIAAQRWLFNETEQMRDREWEVYQQRYD